MSVSVRENRIPALLKYPGGKEKELPYILPNIPEGAENYYEPFAGAGAVFFALQCDKAFLNDKSEELCGLYRVLQERNPEFFERIDAIDRNWMRLSAFSDEYPRELCGLYERYLENDMSACEAEDMAVEFLLSHAAAFREMLSAKLYPDLGHFIAEFGKSMQNKLSRMKQIEAESGKLSDADICANLECAMKNAFYMHLRYLHNQAEALSLGEAFSAAVYFFMREYCYASMFRYNRAGEFNVPYGGISYNRKSLAKKIAQFRDPALWEQLSHATICAMDFLEFAEAYPPGENDFVFLDPPYDTQFSAYSGISFGPKEHRRLASYLIRRCPAYFMLIIKNTDLIRSLYAPGKKTAGGRKLYISSFEKNYIVSLQDRNERRAEHLLVTNYPLPLKDYQYTLREL